MDLDLAFYIGQEDILKQVQKIADMITKDYADKKPVFICVLKGAFMFLSDLIKNLNFELVVDFIRLSSYGSGRTSSGDIKIIHDITYDIVDREVLIVEDIVDTGLTLKFLKEYLELKKPASVKICALFDKPSCRKVPLELDYYGFQIPDKFIVGYGMDFNEKYRNFPDIYVLDD
ncbi:MAG: hypoxanthine phosphoribosyltransferase [Promethearchaeota archaeon]